MKIEQQAQTRAFLIQSFGSVRVGTYTALRSGLLWCHDSKMPLAHRLLQTRLPVAVPPVLRC